MRMFLDASVIVAILGGEADADAQRARVEAAQGIAVSPIVRIEAVLGLARIARMSGRLSRAEALAGATASVDAFLEAVEAETVVVDERVGRMAEAALATYGKAAGHPAALNLGDCFAYACAKARGLPLLYKGEDFARTDLARADLARRRFPPPRAGRICAPCSTSATTARRSRPRSRGGAPSPSSPTRTPARPR